MFNALRRRYIWWTNAINRIKVNISGERRNYVYSNLFPVLRNRRKDIFEQTSIRVKTKGMSYALGLFLVLFAFVVKYYLDPIVQISETPFLLSFVAVVIAALSGGAKPGIFTTVLATVGTIVIGVYGHRLSIADYSDQVRLLTFTIEAIFISVLVGKLKTSQERAITKSKLLINSEKHLRNVLNSLYTFVGVMTTGGILIESNNAMLDVANLSPDEVLGKPFEKTYWWNYSKASEKKLKKAIEKVAKGETVRYDAQMRVGKDKYMTIDFMIVPIRDEQDRIVYLIPSGVDVSQRVQTEQRKDEFISIASHELKTPLTTVKAFTQILEKRLLTLGDKDSITYINKMGIYIDRLTKIIYDFLDFSKIQAGKLDLYRENFDIYELVNEVVDDLQATADQHKIECSIESNKAIIYGDRNRISQVLINLISNAIKYSPEANRVRVEAKIIKDKVIISVRDYGIGIPNDNQKQIFSRFYRVNQPKKIKIEGFGLGLYISWEIISRHGGQMWFESEEGKGSTFYFSLTIV